MGGADAADSSWDAIHRCALLNLARGQIDHYDCSAGSFANGYSVVVDGAACGRLFVGLSAPTCGYADRLAAELASHTQSRVVSTPAVLHTP